MPATILVSDDEKHIVELVRLYLAADGFRVVTAATGREALELVRRVQPDLVVLDLMLPVIDGWEVCRRIRQDSALPVILLTARTEAADKLVGLELGADDYVTKPFNPRELVARVKAVLRRAEGPGGPRETPIAVGDLRVDPARHEVTVGGAAVALRLKEFDLLLALAAQPGIVQTREALLSRVWGYAWFGDSRTLDVHVAWLRQKLAGSATQIETIRGVGYRLRAAG